MKSNNTRIARLREMLTLEEQRSRLQTELDSLVVRISELKDGLFDQSSGSQESSPQSNGKSKATAKPVRKSGGRAPRGALKEQIMTALQAAGAAGVQVKELAEAIGTKAVNIHSWFHSTIKRNPEIKKISGGHYRLHGGGTSQSSQQKSSNADQASAGRKSAKSSRTEAPTAKAGSGSNSAKKSKAQGAPKRGQLSSSILEELKASGKQGITLQELSDKIGAKYKNLSIWFSTTGKKNPSVQKVGPARYRLA
jgi:hypothetical protein